MVAEIFLSALLMTLLGMAYVKGYDMVKSRSVGHLPHFYLIMATARMLLVLTVVGIYVLFADNREEVVRFALTILIMYAMMMVVTLKLRH